MYHLERHDSLKSQVCRTSIRRRPGARRISPRSSFDAESFVRGFGCSRERCTRAVMRFSSSARSAHVEVAREGVRSRARGPAHPVDGSQPRSWARMTFPNGKSDTTSEGSPAPARPHVSVSAASWSHRRTRTTLTCACARDAQMMYRHRLLRHRGHHRRRRRRHRSRSAAPVNATVRFQKLFVVARCSAPSGTPAAAPSSEFAWELGVPSLGAAVGVRGVRWARPEAHLRALVFVCVSVRGDALSRAQGCERYCSQHA